MLRFQLSGTGNLCQWKNSCMLQRDVLTWVQISRERGGKVIFWTLPLEVTHMGSCPLPISVSSQDTPLRHFLIGRSEANSPSSPPGPNILSHPSPRNQATNSQACFPSSCVGFQRETFRTRRSTQRERPRPSARVRLQGDAHFREAFSKARKAVLFDVVGSLFPVTGCEFMRTLCLGFLSLP